MHVEAMAADTDGVIHCEPVSLGIVDRDADGARIHNHREGLENRFARHKKTNQLTRDWAAKHGFNLFPEPGFESVTLTCVSNGARPGGRTVDVAKLQKLTKDQGFLIDGGYGKIKGTTFRISNMGDETEATMNQLFAALDKAMAQL
jgi:aspartate aminotransferase-like enzyme